jgi:putative intracellular protease/amidase
MPGFCIDNQNGNMKPVKILIVVTGTGAYPGGKLRTGLWLSELTHIYDCSKKRGYDIVVASPKGGDTPVDPVSLKPMYLDKLSKGYWNDPEFLDLLGHTKSLDEVSAELFDGIYLAGGHGSMFDFPDSAVLQTLVRKYYEEDKLVSAICHGVCGLLNVKLSDGRYLIAGKKITGFSWFEEGLAGRKKAVPFDLEAALKERGADYRKALIPMTPEVVVDRKLVTGQDPFSSAKMAEIVINQFNQ